MFNNCACCKTMNLDIHTCNTCQLHVCFECIIIVNDLYLCYKCVDNTYNMYINCINSTCQTNVLINNNNLCYKCKGIICDTCASDINCNNCNYK